jgi:hypothetical protein
LRRADPVRSALAGNLGGGEMATADDFGVGGRPLSFAKSSAGIMRTCRGGLRLDAEGDVIILVDVFDFAG